MQGYYGPLTSFGPLDGDLAVSYGYNDLQTKLHSNMLVCYDYTGPESTQFDLSFQVRVSETASGTDQTLHWVSHIDGMTDRSIDADVVISGNLSIAGMSDQTTVQNTTLDRHSRHLSRQRSRTEHDQRERRARHRDRARQRAGRHVRSRSGGGFHRHHRRHRHGRRSDPSVGQTSTTFTLTVITNKIFADGFQ